LRPDGTQEVEYLCEIDVAEERMSRGFGGRSLFDDFFSDFFGDTRRGGDGGGAGRVGAPQRQVERVDVTEFFSDATRELLQRAAQTALEWGSLDLDTDHLLYAALQDDVVRHVLRQVDVDPQAIAAQIEEEADKVLDGSVQPGDRIRVDVLEGGLHFEVESGAASELTAEREEARVGQR
jgi:ATP-dependent Clp protease ATP-binding subunit ClpC